MFMIVTAIQTSQECMEVKNGISTGILIISQ